MLTICWGQFRGLCVFTRLILIIPYRVDSMPILQMGNRYRGKGSAPKVTWQWGTRARI